MTERVKKKILLIANDTTYVYNLRDEVIERFVSEGFEVVIVCEFLNFIKELEDMGCRLISVHTDRHGKNPFKDIELMMFYRKVLEQEKPDVVLTYNIKPDVYGGLACQLTHTHHIANITGLGTALEYPGNLQKLTISLYKAGLNKTDCVFFQNEENRQFFEDHHILKKETSVRLLPGSGVNLKVHQKMEYPSSEDQIHFLFIARIMKEKGIDLYLNAAKRIHETYQNTVFHICGGCDDPQYADLLKETEKTDYIVYHGEQKNMIPFFEMAHCIVHPSYYPEGMSNVLLEAAAHCRPIIATDRAGCREIVDDEKTGFVIPIQNEEALVNALERFLALDQEKKRDMGLAGREKIEREFDRQYVVEAYLQEVRKIIL